MRNDQINTIKYISECTHLVPHPMVFFTGPQEKITSLFYLEIRSVPTDPKSGKQYNDSSTRPGGRLASETATGPGSQKH